MAPAGGTLRQTDREDEAGPQGTCWECGRSLGRVSDPREMIVGRAGLNCGKGQRQSLQRELSQATESLEKIRGEEEASWV